MNSLDRGLEVLEKTTSGINCFISVLIIVVFTFGCMLLFGLVTQAESNIAWIVGGISGFVIALLVILGIGWLVLRR